MEEEEEEEQKQQQEVMEAPGNILLSSHLPGTTQGGQRPPSCAPPHTVATSISRHEATITLYGVPRQDLEAAMLT